MDRPVNLPEKDSSCLLRRTSCKLHLHDYVCQGPGVERRIRRWSFASRVLNKASLFLRRGR